MPRQQAVYGKRSRAANNPAAIFGSPQNLKQRAVETIKVMEVVEENTEQAAPVSTETMKSISKRKALGERNGNAVLKPEMPGSTKHIKKPARRKAEKVNPPAIEHRAKQDRRKQTAPEDVKGDANSAACGDDAIPASRGNVRHAPEPEVDVLEKAHQARDSVSPEREPTMQMEAEYPPQQEKPLDYHAEVKVPLKAATSEPFRDHCTSLLNLTTHDLCSFSDWADQLREHFDLSKIAEASFGEVYRLSLQPDLSIGSAAAILRDEESVLKIIALTPPDDTLPKQKRERERMMKKAEAMSQPADVASEVKLLQRLSSIPGFTNFRDVRVLRGRPAGPFVEAWNAFNAAQLAAKKDISIFPDPEKKASYSSDQLWAVIEMQDAGTDLERLVEKSQCRSVWTVWDVFWQVVLALAKGEGAAEFEHRDLHLGNICVRSPADLNATTTIDPNKKLGFTGIEATLIDYTISRASMPVSEIDSAAPATASAFIDLAADEYLFAGDSTTEYQYDIYRYMRSAVYFSSPMTPFPDPGTDAFTHIAHETGRSWEHFHPLTNLVWLHYVLYMLLEQIEWPSARKAPSRKTKKEEHARWKRANDLELALLRVQDLLDPNVVGGNGVGRAGDLVILALEEGWLDEADVVGEAATIEDSEVGDELAMRLEMLALEQVGAEAGVHEPVAVQAVKLAKRTRRKR